MPRYIEPENPVGIALRAVIEGELLKTDRLAYEDIDLIVTAIEERIQDGPADWLTLSDGTTFSKSWVPARPGGPVEPVERWPEFGGRIDTEGIKPLHRHANPYSDFGNQNLKTDEPVTRAIDSIHAAHEQRVKANTQNAQDARLDEIVREVILAQDLADHDVWLISLGSRRIVTQ